LGSSNVFLLFEGEDLDLEGFSVRERKLDLRESLSLGRNNILFSALEVILFSLRMTFFLSRNLPKVVGEGKGTIYKEIPLLYLRVKL